MNATARDYKRGEDLATLWRCPSCGIQQEMCGTARTEQCACIRCGATVTVTYRGMAVGVWATVYRSRCRPVRRYRDSRAVVRRTTRT